MSESHDPGQERRSNAVTAAVCDEAVLMVESHGRQYAEALLRIYSLKTLTVMRVLFDAQNRRPARRTTPHQ